MEISQNIIKQLITPPSTRSHYSSNIMCPCQIYYIADIPPCSHVYVVIVMYILNDKDLMAGNMRV